MHKKAEPIDLFLFHRDLATDRACRSAGVQGIVFDFEGQGKAERQSGFETEISSHSFADLQNACADKDLYILCRTDRHTLENRNGMAPFIDTGVDELILPMVNSPVEVEAALKTINGQCRLGVMLETPAALEHIEELDQMGLSRFFLGLNDLHILSGERSIFQLLHNGIVGAVRERISFTPFGFGGLTLPGCGAPLPAEYFYNSLIIHECSFTFLRRSFYRDTADSVEADAIKTILQKLADNNRRPISEISHEQKSIEEQLAIIADSYHE